MFEFYDTLPTVAKVALWLIVGMVAFLAWIIREAERSPVYLDDNMTQRAPTNAEPEETTRNEATRKDRSRAEDSARSGVEALRAVGGREIQPTQKEREDS